HPGAIRSVVAVCSISRPVRSCCAIALPYPFAPGHRRLPQFSNNAATFRTAASSGRGIDRAPFAPAANRSPPLEVVAPVSHGPCSPKQARALPFAIAGRQISAETTRLRRWFMPGCWSAFAPFAGSMTTAGSILHSPPVQAAVSAATSTLVQPPCLPLPRPPSPACSHFWNLSKNYLPLPPALEPALPSPTKLLPISDL